MIKKIDLKKLPDSEVEIKAEIPSENFDSYRKKAVAELNKEFELPGFRKGRVPENIFLEKVPEITILEEMAEMAINDAYPKIVDEHKLEPLGRPEVSITKIAKGNPLCFTIKTAVIPEVRLPDNYKKIAGKIAGEKEDIIATDEEVEKAIEEIRKARLPKFSQNENLGGQGAPKVEPREGETPIEPVLPELNDDFVKTLGNFENVSDFKTKLRENIKLEKERVEQEKKRIKIIDALTEKTEVVLPKIVVEEEKIRLLSQLRYDVERLGLKFDEYLKNVNKTEGDIKNEWAGEAEKRAKMEFVIKEIAAKENISPSEEELSSELKHLVEHNKDVDETRARIYLSSILTNQKVMEFLESQE